MKKRWVSYVLVVLSTVVGLAACNGSAASDDRIEMLNVSYDPTREFYDEFNQEFALYWQTEKKQEVIIKQSHGGSGSQARSVIDGLDADVVTLALAYDIDAIAEQGLIDTEWMNRLDSHSAPYTSTIVFLVRKGNPKKIEDWDDLTREDVSVITPNPKASGGARWNYLAAWGFALEKFSNDETKAKDFVSKIYKNVAVLDSGARGSTTTFVEKGIGDVLLAWENEALLALHGVKQDEFEIVAPSVSILAEPSVAIVDKNVDRKGTREVAEAYLQFLYSDIGQEIAAKHYYRPREESIANKYHHQFPEMKLFTIDDKFGNWQEAQKVHFSDGGLFDTIFE